MCSQKVVFNNIIHLLQTRGRYHRHNQTTQDHEKWLVISALQNRCLHTTNTSRSKTLYQHPTVASFTHIIQVVVGLGLGRPRQDQKGLLWWRHHTQPTVIITFDLPKIRPPKDMFLRLRHNWNSRRKCKRVFMIHNFENTECWEDKAVNT